MAVDCINHRWFQATINDLTFCQRLLCMLLTGPTTIMLVGDNQRQIKMSYTRECLGRAEYRKNSKRLTCARGYGTFLTSVKYGRHIMQSGQVVKATGSYPVDQECKSLLCNHTTNRRCKISCDRKSD